ncbi:MAG: AAA family ATPase [Clostridia bacterium]|jgi:guanylate kinase
MSKRVILCGPSAAGKNFIREKFRQRGYIHDVSYTSREPRRGEIDSIDYKFISKDQFKSKIVRNGFYEYVEYDNNYYGTGIDEWDKCDVFIMETDGIKHIKPEDRKESLVIYINTPISIRIHRMKQRSWNDKKIQERIVIDDIKFKDFLDYDLQISSTYPEEQHF